MNNFIPLILTFKLAFITTLVLLILGLPFAYWLAFSVSRFKFFFEVLVSMPLILPPSVMGFYLLVLFSPYNLVGRFLDHFFDVRLVFSFSGLVLASVISNLPFMVNSIKTGFKSFPVELLEAAYTLGKSKLETIFFVVLPNCKTAIVSGMMMTFIHSIGAFGIILMLGGNIPGKTRLVSIAIYDELEALNYSLAHLYSFVLVGITFLVMFLVYRFNKKLCGFF